MDFECFGANDMLPAPALIFQNYTTLQYIRFSKFVKNFKSTLNGRIPLIFLFDR